MGFNSVRSVIKKNKKTWLVTGAAGFIGSHLAENLLHLNQNVVGIDNYSSGSPDNLLAIECGVGTENIQIISRLLKEIYVTLRPVKIFVEVLIMSFIMLFWDPWLDHLKSHWKRMNQMSRVH